MQFLNNLVNGKGTVHLYVDKPYYAPGDVISGSLRVQVHDAIACNEIAVLVAGKEEVSWTERIDVGNRETRCFSNRRDLFNHKLVLSNAQRELTPGEYKYTFQYQLVRQRR
ncbi:hypothetical protein AC1031_006171 [Aphanomyces cochlioides]|nr:hypothetical protein AC1031_006171 [Aphanomyces cochlioides]